MRREILSVGTQISIKEPKYSEDFLTRLIGLSISHHGNKSNEEIHIQKQARRHVLPGNSIWKKTTGRRKRIHYFRQVTMYSIELSLFTLSSPFSRWRVQCIYILHVVTKVRISRISKTTRFAHWNFFITAQIMPLIVVSDPRC